MPDGTWNGEHGTWNMIFKYINPNPRTMKTLVICILLIFPWVALTQPCPDSLFISRQGQIDSFPINYPNCTAIEGNVEIIDNWDDIDIRNLDGLNTITQIGGSLEIRQCGLLDSLSGLNNLTAIGGDLIIFNNNDINNLSGLDGIYNIGGAIRIEGNTYLTSLKGIGNINFIKDDLVITGTGILTNLSGLENIDSIGGDLILHWHEDLVSLSGLNGLKFLGGKFLVTSAFNLKSFTGLDSLTEIGGDLVISGCYDIYDLTGLDNINSIAGDLRITYNPNLIELNGLYNLKSSSIENLKIENNTKLSDCAIKSICDYLVAPGGEIEISGNAPGCNSLEEVQDSCEAHAIINDKNYFLEDFSISPNPFTTSTTLSFRLGKPENVRFTIYNLQSQIVYTIVEWRERGEQQLQWNAEGLPAGMYFYRILAGNRIGSGKLVVGDW